MTPLKTAIILTGLLLLTPLVTAQENGSTGSVDAPEIVRAAKGTEVIEARISVFATVAGEHDYELSIEDRTGFSVANSPQSDRLYEGDERIFTFEINNQDSEREGIFVFKYLLKVDGQEHEAGTFKIAVGRTSSETGTDDQKLPGINPAFLVAGLIGAVAVYRKTKKPSE